MCGIPMTPPEDMGKADEKTIERALAHTGANLENQNTALISEDARDMMLRTFDDFIWRDRNGDGICSSCDMSVDGRELWMAHKAHTRCPHCGKQVQVRDLRYGHSKMEQEFYAVEWRRSVLEKDALVMIGFYCGQDMRGIRPWEAEKWMVPVLIDVFRYGKSAERFQRAVWDWPGGQIGKAQWHRKRDVRPLGTSYFGRKVDVAISERNFRETITGTPFAGGIQAIMQAVGEHGGYVPADYSTWVSAIARRPWIEYMAKAGFKQLAKECIWSIPKGLMNPRKKHVREILKLSPDRYAEIKSKRADISPDVLRLIQYADQNGIRLKLDEAQQLMRGYYNASWSYLSELMELYGPLDRPLIRFLKRHSANTEMRRTLFDYLQAAREAGMDMSAPETRLPHNLMEAHDRAVQLRNETRFMRERARHEKRCDGLQDKLDKRLPELEKKYCFRHDGLILRPARKLIELIDEGNALGHCVGGYVEGYAGGRTDILFLRHEEAPDKPWRTIEFSPATGRMIQDRGYRNDRATGNHDKGMMTPELRARLDAFWAAFEEHRRRKARKSA